MSAQEAIKRLSEMPEERYAHLTYIEKIVVDACKKFMNGEVAHATS